MSTKRAEIALSLISAEVKKKGEEAKGQAVVGADWEVLV